MLSGLFLFLSIFAATAVAAPTQLIDVARVSGETTGRHIVRFKDGVSASSVNLLSSFKASESPVNVTHEWDPAFLNGFAGELDDDALNALRADPNVLAIEEDGIAYTQTTVVQQDAPWGLSRLCRPEATGGSQYDAGFWYYFDDSAGSGVDIYIVDTGIYTAHNDFGGRARWGATFGGYADADGNGHGTHCAGSAAGNRWGVAKAANLIAVKVLSDQGSGAYTDIISGLDWVASSVSSSGRASVASMSLGGGASDALDQAIINLTNRGIHVTVAAGNDAQDASGYSPARVQQAVTVGASTIQDQMASFSNYGSLVDIIAPGQEIISCGTSGPDSTAMMSGTSMATPHVAGLIAYLIRHNGYSDPATMSSAIKDLSTKNVISGVPGGQGNWLARNDV